jgi:glycerol-3-phosphate dehydrogenase
MNTPLQWTTTWRNDLWSQLDQDWDVLIIGGGITGAGILREATRFGLRALLVEKGDFASGTSSRSSKLVHGGLRYLKNAQFKITWESVGERERLLREGKGLINRLGFLYALLENDAYPGWVFRLGLIIYDLMARRWSHRHYNAPALRQLCPSLSTPALRGGYRYFDALTDDARLVLRLIREACRDGGTAIHYAQVIDLLTTSKGQVCGVALQDLSPDGQGRTKEVQAKVVVNATGAWADELRARLGAPRKLRPLRGSHLILPAERLPLRRAVSFLHPTDGRPVFAIPWEGVILFGTTDVDHTEPLDNEPMISSSEVEYLMTALRHVFPASELTTADVLATYSGVRPVVSTGEKDPSKESREHVIWEENGLLTVTGGKLTTFRLMAHAALRAMRHHLTPSSVPHKDHPMLDSLSDDLLARWTDLPLAPTTLLRLLGRYGEDTPNLLATAQPSELEPISQTQTLWVELRWAAGSEGVLHLDDLLLRRVRLGLLVPRGGQDDFERIRRIVQPELGWDDSRWHAEVQVYRVLWQQAYSLPK